MRKNPACSLHPEQISWSNFECCGQSWDERRKRTDGLCLRVWNNYFHPNLHSSLLCRVAQFNSMNHARITSLKHRHLVYKITLFENDSSCLSILKNMLFLGAFKDCQKSNLTLFIPFAFCNKIQFNCSTPSSPTSKANKSGPRGGTERNKWKRRAEQSRDEDEEFSALPDGHRPRGGTPYVLGWVSPI